MKRAMIVLLSLVVVAGVFAAGAGEAESDSGMRKFVVATDATWPPMEFLNEDKEIVGYDIDLMTAIAEAAGFEVEFANTAWDGIFAGLGTNEYDAVISSVTITDERKATMDFSDSYINAGQVLIVAQSLSGVTGLGDMSGKTVGAQIGTTGAFAIEDAAGVELATFDELGLAIVALANGQIDGVVADTPIAADYVLQNDEYSGTLKIVGEAFTDEYYGIAVKKGNSEVLDLINKGLAEVLASNIPSQLEDKWLR
jgi:polar amino acid transport system substrate-binding protein